MNNAKKDQLQVSFYFFLALFISSVAYSAVGPYMLASYISAAGIMLTLSLMTFSMSKEYEGKVFVFKLYGWFFAISALFHVAMAAMQLLA